MVQVLLLTDEEDAAQDTGLGALAAQLEATRAITVTATSAADRLRSLAGMDVVLVRTTRGPLTPGQEAALCGFVRRGGGLVLLGDTAHAWCENASLRELVGLELGRRIPETELIVRADEAHELVRRLDRSFALRERCFLPERLPQDAELVLRAGWQFTSVPVAFARAEGTGWVFCTTLGTTDAALAHPALRRLLYRAVRYTAGLREPEPVGVALIGYGAIGREHGEALAVTPGLTFSAICDRNPARLELVRETFPQARPTTDVADVASDPDIGVAVICTPPNTHAPLAEQLLAAGKHVVVEKPFCMTTAEADHLIALAQEQRLTLTVYQNRRWDPDFLAIQEAVASGAIGDIFHIETFIGGFSHPCDLWHSHEPISGGVFYDWGSHYLDWVLTLVPTSVRDVRATAHKRVWHDVTNADHANIYVTFADGREASFIHSDVAALLKPKWYILGTRGALVASWRPAAVTSRRWSGDLIEEPVAPAEALPAVVVATRDPQGRIHEQRLALPSAPPHAFHRNLADHLLTGEPLVVPPRAARRTIAVLEAAAYSASHEGEVVRLAERFD
jgi:predicted dehydrogenase